MTRKALSIKSMEISLIGMQSAAGALQGSATWMARALKVEESQTVLLLDACRINSRTTENQRVDISCCHDRLQSQINGLVQTAATFVGADWDSGLDACKHGDSGSDEDGTFITVSPGNASHAILPLPSYIGLLWCGALELNGLVEEELQLRQGQANDALHEIQLALADKAVLFRTEVRHGKNYAVTTHAWKKVLDLDTLVKRYSVIYNRCQKQMVALGADQSILDRYQILNKKDLTVSTVVSDPNARGHRHDSLAWFWTMDIPKDTNKNDWMSE